MNHTGLELSLRHTGKAVSPGKANGVSTKRKAEKSGARLLRGGKWGSVGETGKDARGSMRLK